MSRVLYPADYPIFCPECDAHLYDTAKAIHDDDTLMGDQLRPVAPQQALALFMPAPPCNVCGGNVWARDLVSGALSPYIESLEDDAEPVEDVPPSTGSASTMLVSFIAGYIGGVMIGGATHSLAEQAFVGFWLAMFALV